MKKLKFAALLLIPALAFSIELEKVSRIDIGPVWAVNSYRDIVYAGLGGALNIYNIYLRDYPQLVGTIEGHSSNIRSLIVQDERLIVLWEKEGLEIFDISDPYRPIKIGSFSGDERFHHFSSMDIEGNIVFLGGKNFVSTVDIQNPAEPTLLGYWELNGEPAKIDYHNGRLYLAAGNLGLGAFNVFNPKVMQFIGSQKGIYTAVKGYKGWIIYGRLDEPKPNEQTILGKKLFEIPFFHPMTVNIHNDVIFAGGGANFAIYRLIDGTPQQVWNLEKLPTADCVLKENNIYLANMYEGLSVFDITNIENPMQIGRLRTYDIPRRMAVVGTKLYICAGRSGVIVYSVEHPSHPFELFTFGTDKLEQVWAITEHNGKLYLLGGRDEPAYNLFIEKYDMDGHWLAEYPICHSNNADAIGEIVFKDGICAVSLGRNGIAIFRENNGELLHTFTIIDGSAQFCDIEISNGYLYASDYVGGYHIFDIHNGLPRRIGYIKTSETGGNGIALYGKYLLCADGQDGLSIIDVRYPETPFEANSWPTVWGTDIVINDNFAFLSDGQGRMKIFNISNLPEIELVDSLDHSGYWTHLYVSNDLIYSVDEFFGVYIYRMRRDENYVAKSSQIPEKTSFVGAFPNPFNPVTALEFSLAERSETELSIFDISGKLVKTLIADILPAGTYTFKWDATNLPSGTYFAVLKTPKASFEQKLILLR